MKPALTFAAVAAVAALAACYPADDGTCVTPTEDRVYVDNGEHPTGFWCFDDGDGYPTIYPPVTTSGYPTVP